MKRKFSLFLNVAVLALCVCAIAIGVYSAKTASLNVGGTVGFVAHNCKVELSGSIQACATSEETVRTTKQISARTIGESESSYTLNLDTAFGSVMQFSDMFDDGQTIIITLNIKNTSAFAITAKANMPTITGSNISKTVKLGTSTITQSTSTDLEIDGTTTLTITLTLNNTVSSFATNALVSGTIFEFEKKSSVTLISFSIVDARENTKTYNAEEGMTWEEWVNSEYNTAGYIINDTSVCSPAGAPVENVHSTDIIEANKIYTWGIAITG